MNSYPIGKQLKRLPGQWLREKNDESFAKEIVVPLVVAVSGLLMFVLEAMHAFFNMRPSVLGGAIVAGAGVCYAVYKVQKELGQREIRRKGEEGERIVAQMIERDLIPQGYTVFHDIQLCKDDRCFNIDHLLIGKNGVFAVETKNYTPQGNNAMVSCEGDEILWNGKTYSKNAALQAKANAATAHDFIDSLGAERQFVTPVVCAIGWNVNPHDLYRKPVLLVNEKTLGNVISKFANRSSLSDKDRDIIINGIMRACCCMQ